MNDSFYLFAGECFYPLGGWEECFAHVGYSKEEARKLMKGIRDGMNA